MKWQLLTSILLMYGILVLVNIPAPFLGLEFEKDNSSGPRLWYQPPGYVIPIVWFVLFTLLGISRYQLLQTNAQHYTWLLIALAIVCATYAYYTLGLSKLTGISALWFGLAGNIVVIAVGLLVVWQLWGVSPKAASLVIPVVLWTGFATAIIIGEMKLQQLI